MNDHYIFKKVIQLSEENKAIQRSLVELKVMIKAIITEKKDQAIRRREGCW